MSIFDNFYFYLILWLDFREELKRWFIQQEVDLFRYKLSRIQNDTMVIEKFLHDNNLVYVPV